MHNLALEPEKNRETILRMNELLNRQITHNCRISSSLSKSSAGRKQSTWTCSRQLVEVIFFSATLATLGIAGERAGRSGALQWR